MTQHTGIQNPPHKKVRNQKISIAPIIQRLCRRERPRTKLQLLKIDGKGSKKYYNQQQLVKRNEKTVLL